MKSRKLKNDWIKQINMAKKLTTEEIEKLHKMYLEGMTCEKIGQLTGHKTDTVSKYLKENYGIKPQRKIDLVILSKLAKKVNLIQLVYGTKSNLVINYF